jgi:DNA-binding response OmpR family regulator
MSAHILLIEDQVSLAQFIALELSEAGYLVSIKGDNLADLSSILRSLNPDLIILNPELKSGSGVDVCRQLENYQVPIVLVTAGEQWSSRSVSKLSIQDCLTKPFAMNDLLQIIHHHLSEIKAKSIPIQLSELPW